jgi:hypothetical protein
MLIVNLVLLQLYLLMALVATHMALGHLEAILMNMTSASPQDLTLMAENTEDEIPPRILKIGDTAETEIVTIEIKKIDTIDA